MLNIEILSTYSMNYYCTYFYPSPQRKAKVKKQTEKPIICRDKGYYIVFSYNISNSLLLNQIIINFITVSIL